MTEIKKYKTLLRENPHDAEIHFKLGTEYKLLGYYQQAIQHYKESIRIQPSPTVQNSLGTLHLELKNYPEATKHFTQTLRTDPDNADAHNGLGEVSMDLKRYKDAIQHFICAIEIQPDIAIYHFNLGKAYQKLDRYTDAINNYKEAARIDPSKSITHFYLGFVCCKLGQYQDAVHAFKESIKLDPTSAEAHCNLGFAWTSLGNHQEAINSYREAIKINPDLPEVYKNLDEACQKLGALPTKSARKTSTVAPVNSSRGLAKVAGLHELKRLLFEEIIRPTRDPELYNRFQLSIPNGLLLYGPAGCGKTFVAKQLAEELGWYYMELKPGANSAAILLIRDSFSMAEKNAPAILFIDDFENLVPKDPKLSDLSQSGMEVLNEFLARLDQCARKKIFVIAATTHPDKINTAVWQPGRLDKMIYVCPPDLEARTESLMMFLSERPVENIDTIRFARLLEGYSYSDLGNIAEMAALESTKEGKLFISNDHVEKAIRHYPSSLTPAELAKYKNFKTHGN